MYFAGTKVYRVRGAVGAAVHNHGVRGAGVRAVDAPVRLPRDPAHPRALHSRPDRARAARAALAHRPAHTGILHHCTPDLFIFHRQHAKMRERRGDLGLHYEEEVFFICLSICELFYMYALSIFLKAVIVYSTVYVIVTCKPTRGGRTY